MIRKVEKHAGLLYADYQASTPLDPRVAQSLNNYFLLHYANPHAEDHALGWQAAELCDAAARRFAAVLGCSSDEVIFTSGATEANNLAILGLAARRPKSRHRIIVSAIEHKSVLEAARLAATRFGCEVDVLEVDRDGCVDPGELKRRLGRDVLLASIMAVNNEIGSVQAVVEIGRACEEVGAVYHCDAVQMFGAGPIDVRAWGTAMLSLSAHKMYGPKGVGLLFVRCDLQRQMEPLIVGGGQQNGLRSGTMPVPLCISFADAAELMICEDAGSERERVRSLRDRFVNRLLFNPFISLNGPPLDSRHPGNANLLFRGFDGHDLLMRLQPHLAASSSSACNSRTVEASYVLRAIGLTDEEARSSIRFSFGRFTTESDVDRAASLVLDVTRVAAPTV